jgi:hypothetical protein
MAEIAQSDYIWELFDVKTHIFDLPGFYANSYYFVNASR